MFLPLVPGHLYKVSLKPKVPLDYTLHEMMGDNTLWRPLIFLHGPFLVIELMAECVRRPDLGPTSWERFNCYHILLRDKQYKMYVDRQIDPLWIFDELT